MDDFSKYFKSMLEQLMKSGMVNGNEGFDIKAFDLNGASPFIQMFFGGTPDKKEKLAVRKLSIDELEQYQTLLRQKEEIQSKFKRLMIQQKKLEADLELFWQDIVDATSGKVDPKNLTIDVTTGFLFNEVNVNKKEKEEEEN